MTPTGPAHPGMDKDSDRRFTDQEVALVLQRAAEIEERRATTAGGRGLTLGELRDIAREVGLSPEVIDEAVASVRGGVRLSTRSLLGAALSAKAARGVRGRLEEDDLQRLIGVIEDRVDAAGTVTEALGTVRWTSIGRGHKFDRTTQVSLTAADRETQIQVVQRYPSGFRAVLHGLPTAWGAMIGGAVAASVAVAPLVGIGIGLGGAALGLGIGRSVWQMLARKSAREVERVAGELAEAAREMAEK
ncbi:MAG TPA: hypothetical protein VK845_05350 [Gemmatimonadales bacterium]|nr:hypothetical protein [Gemmatimonadales bacterium]